MALLEAPEYNSYDDVPFYRKRWFIVLSFLFCMPVGIIVGLTGDIYLHKDGRVMKMSDGQRIGICLAWAAIVAMNLIRVLNS